VLIGIFAHRRGAGCRRAVPSLQAVVSGCRIYGLAPSKELPYGSSASNHEARARGCFKP
jgi:hypothetical protein